MEAVFVELKREATADDIARILGKFVGEPQKLNLPSAPDHPIVVRNEEDRPQTRLDRMEGSGMSAVVGRIRPSQASRDMKFIVVGHNTVRGAAGCAILNAEYLCTKNYI
jgi:aspartate-semialdehyde dehydrogenase